MPTLKEYAILSAVVYQDARRGLNVNPLPPEWDEIEYPSDTSNNPLTSGFTAGAYRNRMTGETVIAFKGTNFLVGANNGQTAADLNYPTLLRALDSTHRSCVKPPCSMSKSRPTLDIRALPSRSPGIRSGQLTVRKTTMLKKFFQFVLIAGGFTTLPACSDTMTWQEEVKLNDGRVIIVTQKRRCEGAYTGHNFTSCIEREAWLTFRLPEFGSQEIVWNERLKPRTLNVHDGHLYVVGWPATGREFDLYGKPRPPYIGFRYMGKQWQRISLGEIPQAIYDTNLVIDGGSLKTKFLTLAAKEGPEVNGSPGYQRHAKRIDPTYRTNF